MLTLNSPNLPPIEDVAYYTRLVELLPGWRRIGEILIDLGFVSGKQPEANRSPPRPRRSASRWHASPICGGRS
ncbi:MAG TPA: hypothetical protein VHL09_04560 [Dehalococcoidia bacterium]|nr:hypothetical protein [Dehalococcoidia bacterium]